MGLVRGSRRKRVVPVVRVVLDHRRHRREVLGLAAVEVPVAPARGAFQGGGVGWGGCGRREELTAAVKRVAADIRSVVLEALLIHRHHRDWRRVVDEMALQHAVA